MSPLISAAFACISTFKETNKHKAQLNKPGINTKLLGSGRDIRDNENENFAHDTKLLINLNV